MDEDYEIDYNDNNKNRVGNENHVPSNSYTRAFQFSKLGANIIMSSVSDLI